MGKIVGKPYRGKPDVRFDERAKGMRPTGNPPLATVNTHLIQSQHQCSTILVFLTMRKEKLMKRIILCSVFISLVIYAPVDSLSMNLDFNGNNKVDLPDAIFALQSLAGFRNTYPVTLFDTITILKILANKTIEYGPIIVDSSWNNVSSGAGINLSLDRKWNALTLESDIDNLAFVLMPDPDKESFPNSLWSMKAYKGRLYLGYGDYWSNRGPVDIVSYDPLCGDIFQEMLDIPEEMVGDWHIGTNGYLYLGGLDAQESWTFGNFYMTNGSYWTKQRSIYKGLHVRKVIDYQNKLYAIFSSDGTLPGTIGINYPFVVVSENQGSSWLYEQVDQDVIKNSSISDIITVSHGTGEFLYALLALQSAENNYSRRIYRFDGSIWEQVNIIDSRGEFHPNKLIPFGQKVLVEGYVTNSNGYTRAVYAINTENQTAVDFLEDKKIINYTVHEDWLYCIIRQISNDPVPSYNVYRTKNLQAWENLGQINLLPGAEPRSLDFIYNRLYIGATNGPGWWFEDDHIESWVRKVYPIKDDAKLYWDIADFPQGSQVTIKIRTSTNYSDLFDEEQPWIGPDGTENTSFTVSGDNLPSQCNGDTFWRVAIFKTPNSQGETPQIKWIKLTTGNGDVFMAVDEGQGLYAAANSTDRAEYVSSIFSLQEPIRNGKLFFEGATPDTTSLLFQVRSAPNEAQLKLKPFLGPDGTTDTYYQFSGQLLWEGHDSDKIIQYKAILTSGSVYLSPFLHKVILVTRDDRLDHYDIQFTKGSTTWKAGEFNAIRVVARSADGAVVPIQGKLSLLAKAIGKDELVPIEPRELTMVNGAGTANVSLQRAVPTQIFIDTGGVKTFSPEIEVLPDVSANISIRTDLQSPYPNWAPIGQVNKAFSIFIKILDKYGNTVTDYHGTIRCELWQYSSESELFTYTFQPSDHGYRQFSGIKIGDSGEWNIVCSDAENGHIAGTQTINIQE